MTARMRLSAEVAGALASGRPVVALESTIITHGFPYPANVECALTAERVVRDEGAVPATIAVLDGVLRVGLGADEIERLGHAGQAVAKASRRDLPAIIASGGDGATTVAGTMIAAALAGISVFATGGIGGVHRGAETTFDISADLEELAHTSVVVVCAGAKSVLDIGLTLEYLETRGVPVLGYGTHDFPAFYTRTSGFAVDVRVDTPAEVAAIVAAKRELGLEGGVVVAKPVPEAYELDAAQLDDVIGRALAEADASGVRGKDVTPFLLARIHELTGGASQEANKQLAWENARLAARIATALGQTTEQEEPDDR